MSEIAPLAQGQHERAARGLLSPQFLRRLDRLDVLSRKMLAGKLHGERRSKRRGKSVEFADYRGYVHGDDLRFIDWNLYARLDRLFIRLFMEEQDLLVSIVVDVSASMDDGRPHKLDYARRVAAALGYIALTHHNRMSLFTFADGLGPRLTDLRGRRPVPRMLEFLEDMRPAGRGGLEKTCRQLALSVRGRGVVILISDFLDKGDLDAALRWLGGAGSRLDVFAVQVLSPQEMDPAAAEMIGDLRLVDVEDAQVTDVSVTRPLLRRYRQTLAAHQTRLRHVLTAREMAFLPAVTSTPFETLVLEHLRQRGLLG